LQSCRNYDCICPAGNLNFIEYIAVELSFSTEEQIHGSAVLSIENYLSVDFNNTQSDSYILSRPFVGHRSN
jgi:hypothetical protein